MTVERESMRKGIAEWEAIRDAALWKTVIWRRRTYGLIRAITNPPAFASTS